MTGSRVGLAAAAALLAATAGCGTTTVTPGEAVPKLRTILSQVDTALAERQYADARKALDSLVRATTAARDAGQLSTEQADSILAAAAQLTADLPRPAPTPTVRSEPPDDDQGNGEEKKKDKGAGNGKGSDEAND